MKKKGKILSIIIGLIMILINAKPIHSLSNPDYLMNIIKIAYMNGYVKSLELDYEEARDLKQNEDLLKQRVKQEANRYIITVTKLNCKTDYYAKRYK